jgi:ABC-type protease/lipase transport system fused ATPase/permease subunit
VISYVGADHLQHHPAAAPPPAAPAAPPTTAPLPFTHWRKLVHTAHNVIVVGAPQSGKSTLTRAFLSALANSGQICLIDPHDQANDWDCLNWR